MAGLLDKLEQEKARRASDGSLSARLQQERGRRSESKVPGGVQQLNAGIASTLGAPVDLLNAGLGVVGLGSEEPFAGSKSIRRGMGNVGVAVSPEGREPSTFGEYVGRGMGEAAGIMLPTTGLTAAAKLGGPLAKGIASQMSAPFVNAPVRALGSELASGAGAGIGRQVAENADPGNPMARMGGELVGSIAGALGPQTLAKSAGMIARKAPLTGAVVRHVENGAIPFMKRGASGRAARRMQSLSGDPAGDAARVGADSISDLTPAQKTGNKRLMGLERSVRDTDAVLDDAMTEQGQRATKQLTEAMRQPAGDATADNARDFIGSRLDRLTSQLDDRVAKATDAADKRISTLAPERRAAESSVIVREELEGALKAARQEERALWGAVPQDAEVSTERARASFQNLIDNTARAQRDNIPEAAKRFLARGSNEAFADTEPVREVHGLYSEMREVSREARAAGRYNKARMADMVADSLLEDLGARADTPDEIGQIFNDARKFSAEVNKKFRQGSVGNVLGYEREGGLSVAPELTLDVTAGRPGTKGAIGVDELRAAIGGSSNAEAATQDYIKRRFTDYAAPRGEFSASRAQDFVRKNTELLERFPALRNNISNAEQAKALADRVSRTAGSRATRLRDPKVSRAAEFLNAPVDQEFATVLRSKNPAAAARELRRQVSKDKTGKAVRGLKSAAFDYMMDKAATRQFDDAGQSILSGNSLKSIMSDRRASAALREILSDAEMTRMQRISRELSSVEASQGGNLPNVGSVMNDTPSTVIQTLARMFAARAGARAGHGISGASIQTANIATKNMDKLLKFLTNDRAEAMIREAITGDEDLFRMLLTRGTDAEQLDKTAFRVLEWLQGYTGAQIGGGEDPQTMPKPSPIRDRREVPDIRSAGYRDA